ncbi:TonB-dependent receptor plug domain-containing protein [Aquincola tertiaricarbonis]|uniref:TonB-dependent receptor plug domain-containing protein n=1 Tax=Aquincola tertiaricarbonis TaxID=391953 RepID=UPI000B0F6753|nr:TonB-dependent receptor [Aquincola tertiaricarbonis]
MSPPLSQSLRPWLLACAASTAAAQPVPPPPAAAASASAASAPVPAQRVEVTGSNRRSDADERRQSTAAKVVVGREEIERFGDANVSDVLRRLPGVTVQGSPGRGGTPRMRGLGSGYTQILVDGEPLPAGFSVDSLSPEQLQRIELLRGPTAETGARAIAGTINIVTRENQRQPLNDWRLTSAFDEGQVSPTVAWTRGGKLGEAFDYTASLSVYAREEDTRSSTRTVSPTLEQQAQQVLHDRRKGLRGSGRLRWRLGEGESLTLTPYLLLADATPFRAGTLQQTLGAAPYERFRTDFDNGFQLRRLNAQLNRRLGEHRLEWRVGGTQAQWSSDTLRAESGGASPGLRTDATRTDSDDASTTLKLSTPLGERHNLVSGLELAGQQRDERRATTLDGLPVLDEFGDNLSASSRRWAVYVQDEWSVSPQLDLQLGLRGEGIRTEGSGEGGARVRNSSTVWTPLLHGVWRPDAQRKDQVRLSLTRSYRAPTLQNLIGRPALSTLYPTGANEPTSPDRAGNPDLRPEIATGIDLAFERHLAGGGLLSANLFHRQIRDLMRTVTTLETVSWSTEPRWVARPRNIGDATTSGVELEARFKLDALWAPAPAVDVRSNLSLFRSRVKSVPGPDNRLDQQPGATLNLGADYRLTDWPLTLGATLNLTPGYDARLSEDQFATQNRKRVIDAYALWRVRPGLQLRVSASNLAPLDDITGSVVAQEQSRTVSPSTMNWQLQLEMKL